MLVYIETDCHVNSHYRLYTTAVTKIKMLQQNAVHGQQSVTRGISLSVSKSKLVYCSLIFVAFSALTLGWVAGRVFGL